MKPVDPTEDKGFSLRRWSQRKTAARAAPRTNAERDELARASAPAAVAGAQEIARAAAPAGIASTPVEPRTLGAESGSRADVSKTVVHARPGLANPQPGNPLTQGHSTPGHSTPASPLPSIDSLGIDSDFTAFMQPGVDESLKRGALKKLFSDPRFNVMDGLDVYIDDYSKPDPIDPAIVRTLAQARYIFNPPATRVTAEGHVEDIPEEELRAAAQAPDSQAGAEPEAAGHDAAAVLPDAQPSNDTVPAIAHPQNASGPFNEQDASVPFVVQPQVGSGSSLAQDDAAAATKTKSDLA